MKISSTKLVRDLMTVGVATCAPENTVAEIARLLLERNLDEVVVLEEGNQVGVVGLDELLAAYKNPDAPDLSAEAVMRPSVPTLPPDTPLEIAAEFMRQRGLQAVYLSHHAGGVEYPAAALTLRHLLRHLAATDEQDLKDLGIYAARKNPLEAFIARRDAARKNTKE